MSATATLASCLRATSQCYPQRPAAWFKGRELDYAGLQRRVDQLATLLCRDGAGPGARVGIFLNTSLEALVAVHGVLAAGAAYVPLDPALPLERLQFILHDCGITQLITQRERLPKIRQLPATVAASLKLYGPEPSAGLDCTPWAEILAQPATPDLAPPGPGDSAYIMYTSGSTGPPKGIVHTHASGLAYAAAAAEAFSVTTEDRIAGFAPLHFDQSTFHLFSAPLTGAGVVLVPDEYGSFPVDLARLISEQAVSIWYSVPYVLIQLAGRGELQNHAYPALRWVKFGGEAFPPKYLRTLIQHFKGAGFANIYGPAEVNQCLHYVLEGIPEEADAIPIGRPWACAKLAVVDEALNDVAPGEPGELLVATTTMMARYWGREDLNQKAFVLRPQQPGLAWTGRYYRTGDLVRRQQDGNFEFLGRRDRQVKARGYRIELDEVENALNTHPEISEAAAWVVPTDEGSQRLEAAVILHPHCKVSAMQLTQHLLARLPRYAIPQQFHFPAAFPRTGSGKIDRRKLAEPAGAKSATETSSS